MIRLLLCDQASTVLRTSHSRLLRYSPFGARNAGYTLLGFVGQCIEPQQQTYLLGNGHRLYCPSLARFSSSDPLSPFGKGGMNSYAWCGGDPVNSVDPTGGFPVKIWAGIKKWFGISQDFTNPAEVQTWTVSTAKRYVRPGHGIEKPLHVYEGWVFRGDQRAPETIFKQGFSLRRPVTDKKTITGELGGFGGGKDALDPDGGGISTSAFYNKDGAGAFFYGAGRESGGYTYLIDGRRIRGYELYRNWGQASGGHLTNQPWEINYGEAIPASKVKGVYNRRGHFRPNPGYR